MRTAACLVLCAIAACTHAPTIVSPCNKHASFDRVAFPLVIRGSVREMRPDAVHIDFDWGELTPDGVCIVIDSPKSLAGSAMWLYYEDAAEVAERGIEVGSVVQFTVPSSRHTVLAYVVNFSDITVVAPGDGAVSR